MVCAVLVISTVSIVGCRLTFVRIPNALEILISVVTALAGIQILPIIYQTMRKYDLRDAALTIPWALVLWASLPFPIDVAARVGMHRPLYDSSLAHLDLMLGVNVPAIMHWASAHWLGRLINGSYFLLVPFMWSAFFVPSLSGHVKRAQQFLNANVAAFAMGLPVFAMFPAVGPWYAYRFTMSQSQEQCFLDLVKLRSAAPYVHHASGVICFPSFHVFWALLCVYSLWDFKSLRIPAMALSGAIIFSTMSTGWHYFCDVLGGVALSAASIAIAKWLGTTPPAQASPLLQSRMPPSGRSAVHQA